MSEQKRRPFVLGRRCPDNNFKQSVARQLRMLSLVADADYIERRQQADHQHPGDRGLRASRAQQARSLTGARRVQRKRFDRATGLGPRVQLRLQ